MNYLILCVLMNVWVYIAFRLFNVFKLDNLTAIIVNYFFCVLIGVVLLPDPGSFLNVSYLGQWGWITLILGGLFILNFFLIAITTQKSGVVTASVASKVSLVIPMAMSMIFIGLSKEFNWINYMGLISAVAAVFLTSFKKNKLKSEINLKYLYLPLLVFIFSGLIDTTINFTNYLYLDVDSELVFPTFIFFVAFIFGIILLIVKKKQINLKNILGGAFLGIPNFLAVLFLIRTLSAFDNDGAVVYSSVNLGVIIIASFISIIFFKEKLSAINWLGFLLAILSLLLVYHQEIIGFII